MTFEEEFAQFWQASPRRTEKIAAKKAYRKARTIATAQEILDGVERYKRNKPSYADWCHPATFLNKGRWMDEPDAPASLAAWVCLHEPRCEGRWVCHRRTQIEELRRQESRQ